MAQEQLTIIVEDEMTSFVINSIERTGANAPLWIGLDRMAYFTDQDRNLARRILLRCGFSPIGDGDRWATGGVFSKSLEEVCVLDDLTDILDDHLPVTEDA